MFWNYKLFSDIKPLKNWDVSNGKIFAGMFKECYSLSNIYPLKNWNVSNGIDFSEMFRGCIELESIMGL